MTLDAQVLAAALGSWTLTYLLHATVLLTAAALAALALRRRPDLEEAVWKLALVGGLLTASLQPAVGAWRASSPTVDLAAAPALRVAGLPAAPVPVTPRSEPAPRARSATAVWPAWLLGGWSAVAVLLLARLVGASLVLRRRLASRRVISGPLARLVDRLLRAAGRRRSVRLTRSDGIPVPIALGGEICLPERALRELPRREQETVVAHEMAHVLRRDPAWLLAGRILAALLFFHPLVLLAGRRLRRVAELRCDDWAAAATGRPLDLARCLTRVAAWGGEAMPAAAMAGDRRWLTGRVSRLLARDRQEPPAAAPRWLRPAAAAVLLALVIWVPGVSVADQTPSEPPASGEESPVLAAAPPIPAPVEAPPAVAPPAPAPRVAPGPHVAPAPFAPPARPAFAIPAPGPLPPDELAGEARERRDRIEAELTRVRDAQREEMQRLARELAGERQRMAEEMAEEHQRLADERQALMQEARRTADEARAVASRMRAERDAHREQIRQVAEEANLLRGEAQRELERLAPELERLRQELRLRTEEREQLYRELEALRRELDEHRREAAADG